MNVKQIVASVIVVICFGFCVWFYTKPSTVPVATNESGWTSLSFSWSENENMEVLLTDQNTTAVVSGMSRTNYFLAVKGNRKFEGSANTILGDWEQEAVPLEPGKWLMKQGQAEVKLDGPVVSVKLTPDGPRVWFPLIVMAAVFGLLLWIVLVKFTDPLPNALPFIGPRKRYNGRTTSGPEYRPQAMPQGNVPQRGPAIVALANGKLEARNTGSNYSDASDVTTRILLPLEKK